MSSSAFWDRRDSPEFRELFDILNSREPTGATVLGGLGMGKTSLVETVLSHTDAPMPVMRLYCSPSLSRVPYGVLSPYLGSLQKIRGPVEVLREMNRTLMAGTVGNYSPIVVVEDAQHLDRETGLVLSLLVENAAMKLVAVGSGVINADSPLAVLTKSDALSTIVVQPLDLDGARTVAEELLDGRIGEGTARIIHTTSGGNPGFVRAYVQSCKEQGILFRGHTLAQESVGGSAAWFLARPMPAVDEHLKDLVQEMRSLTPEQEQGTLELLALAGALPGRLLARCGFPYRRLLDAGELRHSADSVVSIASELYESVLRQTVSFERRAELYAQWNQERRAFELAPTPLQVLWGIEVGAQLNESEILRAVEQAAAAFDFELALNLCTSTEIAAHSQQGALLEARVLTGLERFTSSLGLLVRLIEQTSDAEHLLGTFRELMVVLSNANLEPQDGEMIVNLCESRIGRMENEVNQGSLVDRLQTDVRSIEYLNSLNTPSEAPPAVSELEDLLASGSMAPICNVVIRVLISDMHSIAGRCETALNYACEAWDKIQEEPRLKDAYQLRIVFRIGWNLLFSGRYGEAAKFIESLKGTSLQMIVRNQGTVALLRGLADLLQGRISGSIGELTEAITELRLRDPAQLLSVALHLQQWAIGQIDTSTTTRPATGLDGTTKAGGATDGGLTAHPSAQHLLARAIATTLGASNSVERVADFPLIKREMMLLESAQIEDDALAVHPAQQRLKQLLPLQEGSRVRLIARLVALREATDLDGLEELGREAVQHGEYQIGLEALTRVALRCIAAGEQRGSGAILRQISRIVDEQNLNAGRFITLSLALTELTAREKEIVALARAGKNNGEIARALTVSQRTVEGHLYRVFSKLGISDRAELNSIG